MRESGPQEFWSEGNGERGGGWAVGLGARCGAGMSWWEEKDRGGGVGNCLPKDTVLEGITRRIENCLKKKN